MSAQTHPMRVARYYSNRDVRLEQMPVPRIAAGEVLVRVHASGVCGTDVLEWYRLPKAPLVLGHEIAGEIAAVGEAVSSFKPGDRVVATHHVPCHTCHHCLRGSLTVCETLRRTKFDPGGFAEYLRLEPIHVDRGLLRVPDSVSLEEASLTEPLGCVVRGQRKSGLEPGMSVCVIGSGLTGLLHIQCARAFGAGLIAAVDVRKPRLEAARRFGADLALDAREDVPGLLRQANSGRLADLVVVCAGARTAFEQALATVERGGSVLVFAPTEAGVKVPISVNELFFRDGITLTSSYAASLADLVTALELIRARRVDVADMITHRLGLAETGMGFGLVIDGESSLKVIIEPQR